MKRLSLQVLVLSLVLLVPVVVAQALPVWLSGSTVVATAGPLMTPGEVTAMMLENATLGAGGSVVENPDGSVTFWNGTMTMEGMWQWDWDEITLDPDPSVAFVGAFTNLSGMTQSFVFSISTPISPALPTSLYGGSTSVTVADAGGMAGATLSNPMGQPGYAGTIDGGNQLLLLNPLSLVAPPSGTNSKTEFNGLIATIPGPAVNSTIGITHKFDLTTQDNATFNSTFNVVIPEPGTIALLAAGVGGLALLGRRRKT